MFDSTSLPLCRGCGAVLPRDARRSRHRGRDQDPVRCLALAGAADCFAAEHRTLAIGCEIPRGAGGAPGRYGEWEPGALTGRASGKCPRDVEAVENAGPHVHIRCKSSAGPRAARAWRPHEPRRNRALPERIAAVVSPAGSCSLVPFRVIRRPSHDHRQPQRIRRTDVRLHAARDGEARPPGHPRSHEHPMSQRQRHHALPEPALGGRRGRRGRSRMPGVRASSLLRGGRAGDGAGGGSVAERRREEREAASSRSSCPSYLDHGGTTPFIRAYATDCPTCSFMWASS